MMDISTDWYQAAQDLCIPALKADSAEQEAEAVANQYAKNVITVASNIGPVSGKLVRAMLELWPGAEIEYKPINQKSGEIEERVA